MCTTPFYRFVCAWPALFIFFVALLSALAAWYFLPPDSQTWLLRENGPIEGSTAALFFLLAVLGLLWRPAHTERWSWLAVCGLCLAAGAREMDWHKLWTGKSVLKVSFYLGDAPALHKLLALLVVLCVLACVVYLLLRYGRSLWQALWHGDAFARTIATLLASVVFTKIMDRSVNVLAQDFGVLLAPATVMLISMVEEVGEISLPLMVALAIWQQQNLHRVQSS
jgi:hypothetical protein